MGRRRVRWEWRLFRSFKFAVSKFTDLGKLTTLFFRQVVLCKQLTKECKNRRS